MSRVVTRPHPLHFPRPRRRSRAQLWIAAGLLLAVLLGMLLGPRVLLLVRADVLPGTTVAGVDVGGLDGAELRERLAALAAERADAPLTVTRGLVAGRVTGEPVETEAPVGDAGYRFDVDATAERVLALGRQPNPIDAWPDHIAAFGAGTALEPVEYIDDEVLAAWADETAAQLSVEPLEGAVALEGTEVVRSEPEPGMVVPADTLAEHVRTVLLDPDRAPVDAPLERSDPVTTTADVETAFAAAQRAVSAPVSVSRNDGTATLAPEQLADLLVVRRRDEPPRLVLDVDATRLRDTIGSETIAAFERDPVDAEIQLVGERVEISESAEGFRFDAARAAEQVRDLATGTTAREGVLEGDILQPALSTEQARALEIVEPVASFTTHFTPGQSRVTNIRLIAEKVDGVVLLPGESFSVNDHVGERTEDKGFVGGGAILRGEFVEEIGGGVSQFATTLYNAAYFGGYELVMYQAHSYYISRYPMGREATLNYPTIDLEIGNTSPYGLLIATSSTESSVTVTMWGKTWVDVESITSEPFNRVPGEVRDGFDVTDVRVLRYPDGSEEREERFTRYLPEDASNG